GWNFPYGAEARITSGCSKRPPRKAAVSEEAKRYGPHFVKPLALAMNLGERISPSVFRISEGCPSTLSL
ncbi:MAG: hypothetical protein ABI604_15875, partial [Nitrospirota bacterium]